MSQPLVKVETDENQEEKNNRLAEYSSMLDAAPINIIRANLNRKITYINPSSIATLKKLEKHLPIRVEQILGSSIDIFHKDPSHQAKLLENHQNLPHRAQIKVGDEILDLLVSATFDSNGNYNGQMVTWDIITDSLIQKDNLARIKSMIEGVPLNVMYADKDRIIQYVNPTAEATLKKIEKLLPCKAKDVLGSNIDIFHKDPSFQEKIVSDDRNLPHQAIITLGNEKLDLLITATYDDNGDYIGPTLTWDIVTEKIKTEREMARTKSMMDNMPINAILADIEGNIHYMNPESERTLRSIENLLPCKVENIIGQSMDIFHKNPPHQRKIIANPNNLPHKALIKVGDQTLRLLVSAIIDEKGEYAGPMVTWSIVTDTVNLVNNLTEMGEKLAAASSQLEATSSELNQNADKTSLESNSAASASEEIARGVETVATNTEEMNAAIKEIARNANEASGMSQETLRQAQSTNSTISVLGQSSQEIGKVIKVISSIAQQTNLLALNATIEAARAGDAGRGFAVVANEVKELAKQTASATEEITAKIGSIQGDTSQAVDAISTISKSIEHLNSIAGSIAASVEEQQATTNELSRVVQESASGVKSIATSVKVVNETSQITQTGCSQTLSAVSELKDLAESLRDLISKIEI